MGTEGGLYYLQCDTLAVETTDPFVQEAMASLKEGSEGRYHYQPELQNFPDIWERIYLFSGTFRRGDMQQNLGVVLIGTAPEEWNPYGAWTTVYVHPDYRNKGLGKHFVSEVVSVEEVACLYGGFSPTNYCAIHCLLGLPDALLWKSEGSDTVFFKVAANESDPFA